MKVQFLLEGPGSDRRTRVVEKNDEFSDNLYYCTPHVNSKVYSLSVLTNLYTFIFYGHLAAFFFVNKYWILDFFQNTGIFMNNFQYKSLLLIQEFADFLLYNYSWLSLDFDSTIWFQSKAATFHDQRISTMSNIVDTNLAQLNNFNVYRCPFNCNCCQCE